MADDGDPIRVLYVDDERSFLEIVKVVLERDGSFCIYTTPYPAEALERLSSEQFDVVISDYRMIGMDGIAFLKKVREIEPNIPFILFTGRGREDVVIEAINNGATFYLQKGGDPAVQFAELAHKIRESVRRRKVEEILYRNEDQITSFLNSHPHIPVQGCNRDRRVFSWNPASEVLYGYSTDEAVGRLIEDLIISPSGKEQAIQDISLWFEDGRSFPSTEMMVVRKDGSQLKVFIWYIMLGRSSGLDELYLIHTPLP
ncbi:MAG TPA: response regulator [Methanospirillum sp.]|nr:response regulator [Methanospirillum sp.]